MLFSGTEEAAFNVGIAADDFGLGDRDKDQMPTAAAAARKNATAVTRRARATAEDAPA